MDPHWKMVQAITVKHNNKIKKACSPIFEAFNLNELWYYKILENGDKIYFGSNPEWSEFYVSNNFDLFSPVNCHPKFYRNGCYTFSSTKSFAESRSLPEAKRRFNINPKILIIEGIEGGVEGVGFSSPSSESKQTELLLIELAVLKLFFKRFRKQHCSLFSELQDYKINLKQLIGSKFYENRFFEESVQMDKKIALLKLMGLAYFESITQREVDVAKLVVRGFSAGQIAIELDLSKRTVEHRIERLKEKLNAHSKAELIEKIRELEEIECL
ncbi:MAG: helix-turn-helix transcriptional regulator [Parachlamydiales bacterium]|nr:helix-turn-helix transcriptional regulator [Parachlamydiales bacterium]